MSEKNDRVKHDENYNVILNAIDNFTKEEILKIYFNIYKSRSFEKKVIEAVNAGRITYQVYLSMGQEAVSAALADTIKEYLIFAQHRAHDLYLHIGGSEKSLRDELLGLESGSSSGRAGSNCLQIHENGIQMFGHHGLIGENVPQAVGAALGSGMRTIAIFGDGAAEEDYIYPSLGFAITHKLPIIFLCMDNGLSILTKTEVRRSWEITDMARSMGMMALDMSDCPWTILKNIKDNINTLPLFINCRVCRERWHVGVGVDNEREWKRNEIVRHQIVMKGYLQELQEIEKQLDKSMEEIWQT